MRCVLDSQRGLTPVGVMVRVLSAVLAFGAVGLVLFKSHRESELETARHQCLEIVSAVQLYKATRSGACPKNLESLQAAGYATTVSSDPWNSAYEISCPGETSDVDVISSGPDGELGTEDDVSNVENESAHE